MRLVAVADTGPIIHLAEVDALQLLSTVEQLYLPETVLSELEEGGVPDGLPELEFDLVTADPEDAVRRRLDSGETAVLAVAREYEAVLLTDDMAAREAAVEEDVEVHGSIGVIALGHSRGKLDRGEAASVMRALQSETSLFVTDAVVERGIEMLSTADENESEDATIGESESEDETRTG